MKDKKERLMNNISTQQWLDHFESLFNGGLEAGNDNDNADDELDIVLEESSDEIEEHIFNLDITDDEILFAITGIFFKKGL